MKLAKSLTIAAIVACTFSAQGAQSSDFVKSLLGQFSGAVVSWDDLESRHHALEVQIRQAQEAGNITVSDADALKRQLNPVSDAVIQGRASGRPLSFTQGMMYSQTINGVTAALQQAIATKQSALPDIDALQVELSQKIDESLNANQLTQDDAAKLKGELRTVADIESTIKSSGDGSLSAKQVETISGRLSDIKTQLVQAIKMGESAIPELNHRFDELQRRVNDALGAGQIGDDQAHRLMGALEHSNARMKEYLNASQFLNGKQILELAGNLDHVANDLHGDIAANIAARQAANQTPPPAVAVAVIPPPMQTQPNMNAVNVTDLSAMSEQGNANKYPDVIGYWGEPYISILASRGIIGGFPDGTFHPNDNITRAQFAAIAVKALNVPPNSGTSSFNDVAARYWGAAAIGAVSSAGLVTGFPDGNFKPEDKLTRAQALVILAKALGPGYSDQRELAKYSDAQSVPNWAMPSVTRAASAHIIANFPDAGVINPNGFATRGEVAALMYQTLVALHKPFPRISIGLLPQFAAAPASPPAQMPQLIRPPVQEVPILTIDNVEVSPAGQLSAGDVLTVRAFGSRDAVASFSIKDGVQNVPMDERREGVYEGTYTVRKTDNIGRTRVYVSLNKRGAQPATGQSRNDLMLDAMPPEIMVEPRPNTVAGMQPNVVVKFTDGHGSGVDPASVHLLINDNDVTGQSIRDGNMVAFRPGQPLAGMVRAEIKLADKCGNAVDYRWTFSAQ
jgi:hypothetical protein